MHYQAETLHGSNRSPSRRSFESSIRRNHARLKKKSAGRPIYDVKTLGGYQISRPAGGGADSGRFLTADDMYVEYQGKVYPGDLISSGTRLTAPVSESSTTFHYHLTAPRPAFNKIAAAFLTRQLGSTPEHDVMYIPGSCYQTMYLDGDSAYQSRCGY